MILAGDHKIHIGLDFVYWAALFVFPLNMIGQTVIFQVDSIPVKNGEVVFEAHLETVLSQEQINARFNHFISKMLNPASGKIVEKVPERTVCEIVDYIDVGDNFFQSFGVYMIYTLELGARDGLGSVKIDDIQFLEKGYYQSYMDPSDSRSLPLMSARDIMLDRTFKQMFFKDASLRITQSSIDRVNVIVEDLQNLIED